jgi:tripartite-type tricarboxylate transporter receptor subunit TctC
MSRVFRLGVRRLLMVLLSLQFSMNIGRAYAEDVWPSHKVTILLPYQPGGLVDVTARILAEGLQEKTHRPFVVFNRPGGNGQVGLGDLTRSDPDGYTLLVNNEGGLAVQPSFDKTFRFDPTKDYTPLAQMVATSFVLSARSGLPVHSLADLIAYAEKAPNPLTYASPGIGTTPDVGMQYFAHLAGIKLLDVPYPGGTGPINDLLGGQIDLYLSSLSTIAAFIKTDRIQFLATMGTKRLPQLPDVPTTGEAGLPNFVLDGGAGIFGPPNMTATLRNAIGDAVAAVVHDPTYAEKFQKIYSTPVEKGAKDFPPFYYGEVAKWKRFSLESGIKSGG